jgi:uncharacterized protein (TIGR02145 family)
MKKFNILFLALLFFSQLQAQVGIGTTIPNANAVLEVVSTSQGVGFPQLTTAQRDVISSPATGLTIYNTTTNALQTNAGTSSSPDWRTWPVDTPSVVSTTGKTWMDRNLGATQVATSSTDAASYGDLYQWGRNTDGHQIRTSATVAGTVASGAEGTSFITGTSDWLTVPDGTRWAASKTANDPCPSGFRVPTGTEWEAERAGFSNASGAYASVLKLPVAGSRAPSGGELTNADSFGFYWSSSSVSGTSASGLRFYSSNAKMLNYFRANGLSVRCIKE